ncbi:MAG: DUF1134 domain-containing protein [Hyphomicrobiales bacterium]|nr:DUF1134 domain-containing protein [Hyphomicrobiales bacterium]
MRHRSPLALILLAGLALALSGAWAAPVSAQYQPPPAAGEQQDGGFTAEEIKDAGHRFFGGVSRGLALAVEEIFSRYGRPNGYILGEEAGGALFGGLRYGEGVMYTRNAGTHKVFWQGPSIGWDIGADGDRTMILVYNLTSTDDIYGRFGGVAGAAYFIGGIGFTVMSREEMLIAPIRAGIGARLGVNVGYLKFTPDATWNPF